ncbi:3-keto-disaccharide hydrolase [Aestuariivivens sediminis]|uniref:3-keto-disaccharide hydrolase n=1 Tax=Aestuariivivens sediminis TaxID=2913557 RepID=UPI001F5A4AB5|nr:DUF1080 domain-containing protein [Aestuariivivens sediminis]
MKKITILLLGILFFVACKKVVKTDEVSMEIVEQEAENQSSDWITLFDGTSFDHWRGYLSDSMPPEWSIENGTMVFTPSEEGNKNIITKEKFTNFILSLEWKISEGGNSGIFLGVFEDEKFDVPYRTGLEIQVLDNERHEDAFKNPKFHQAGALYDLVQPKYDVCKPAGQWNLCVIEVNHDINKGSVTLNGTEIVTFPLHGEQWDALVENSKFKGWEGFGKYPTGHIGLQDHSDKVWYRNIKLKIL